MRQWTATLYIVEESKVLLIYHRMMKKWLPPGGHLEVGELPPEGALREALEETGLEVELLKQENVWIEKAYNSRSFPRPYLCLIENIPAREHEPAHEHIDFVYVGSPVGGKMQWNAQETEHLRWFTRSEIDLLKLDEEIFQDTKATISQIFIDFPHLA